MNFFDLLSDELLIQLPALIALTNPPFKTNLASSFGISRKTELDMKRRRVTDSDMAVFSFAVSRESLPSLV